MNNLGDATVTYMGISPALEVWNEAIEFAQSRGLAYPAMWSRGERLIGLYHAGEWDELLREADEVLHWEADRGGGQLDVFAHVYAADVLAHRAALEEAAAHADSLLPHARDSGDPQVLVPGLAAAAPPAPPRGGGRGLGEYGGGGVRPARAGPLRRGRGAPRGSGDLRAPRRVARAREGRVVWRRWSPPCGSEPQGASPALASGSPALASGSPALAWFGRLAWGTGRAGPTLWLRATKRLACPPEGSGSREQEQRTDCSFAPFTSLFLSSRCRRRAARGPPRAPAARRQRARPRAGCRAPRPRSRRDRPHP